MEPNPNSSKIDRKTIEKNRRVQMNKLYSTLTSLVPRQSPREVGSIPDQLEGAANYIKKLQANIENMKEKKKCLVSGPINMGSSSGSRLKHLPSIDVRVMGSGLEVLLTCGPTCRLMLSDVIRVLHEEGADVVTASFVVLENMSFHTLHCKISGDHCSQQCGAERIYERLICMSICV